MRTRLIFPIESRDLAVILSRIGMVNDHPSGCIGARPLPPIRSRRSTIVLLLGFKRIQATALEEQTIQPDDGNIIVGRYSGNRLNRNCPRRLNHERKNNQELAGRSVL